MSSINCIDNTETLVRNRLAWSYSSFSGDHLTKREVSTRRMPVSVAVVRPRSSRRWLVYVRGLLCAGESQPLIRSIIWLCCDRSVAVEQMHGMLQWRQIASFGFVIVAPMSCSVGCKQGGWDTYYEEQLKVIDWAHNVSHNGSKPKPGETWAGTAAIDWTKGVGVVGHSMGGQATVRSAGKEHVVRYNISAAVLHHPFWDKASGTVDVAVPISAFTGVADHICPPNETKLILSGVTGVPITYRNQLQPAEDHLEPVLVPPIESSLLGACVPRSCLYTRVDQLDTSTLFTQLILVGALLGTLQGGLTCTSTVTLVHHTRFFTIPPILTLCVTPLPCKNATIIVYKAQRRPSSHLYGTFVILLITTGKTTFNRFREPRYTVILVQDRGDGAILVEHGHVTF